VNGIQKPRGSDRSKDAEAASPSCRADCSDPVSGATEKRRNWATEERSPPPTISNEELTEERGVLCHPENMNKGKMIGKKEGISSDAAKWPNFGCETNGKEGSYYVEEPREDRGPPNGKRETTRKNQRELAALCNDSNNRVQENLHWPLGRGELKKKVLLCLKVIHRKKGGGRQKTGRTDNRTRRALACRPGKDPTRKVLPRLKKSQNSDAGKEKGCYQIRV